MLVRQLLAVLGSIFVYCVLSLKSSVYLYKTLHNIINDILYMYRVFQGRLYNFNVPFSVQIEQVDQVSRALIDH